MKKVAIFASGSGSNAENIINYFRKKQVIDIKFTILTNNPKAYVIERAKKLNIKYYTFTKEELYNGVVKNILFHINPDLIVLAGFLLLFPENIISDYPNIINIHPALLPKYGGKGMFGNNVHKAVIENKEKISGITIHYVNNEYDKGNIILQKECKVEQNDTIDTLAQKIHKLEYKYFPLVIETILNKTKNAS